MPESRRVGGWLLVALVACSSNGGNDPNPGAARPEGRWLQGMAYDAGNQRVLLFGGSSTHAFGDLWAWNGTGWSRLSDGAGPPPRDGAVVAYDPASQHLLLWGGRAADGTTRLSDAWSWDGTGWTGEPASGVGPYEHASGGFDPERGRFVVFTTTAVAGSAGSVETWERDDQAQWSRKATTGAASFTVPLGSPLPFLSARHSLVGLFGDALSSGTQLWEWKGTNWTSLGSGPGIGPGGPLVATGNNDLVAFDGDAAGPGKTYGWNGISWTQVSGPGPGGPRFGASMVYDQSRHVVVLFGGWTGSRYLADTWEFDGVTWRQVDGP